MRWKPKRGEWYIYVNDEGRICNTRWFCDLIDKHRFNIGNIFRTRKQAEQAAVKVRRLLLGLQRGKV